jgi:hypothetical protein
MANEILWKPQTAATLLTTELNNMADAAIVIDAADYDNATNKFRWANFFLYCTDFDAAPDSGAYFDLHLFYKLDGTNYGDGESGDAADPTPTSSSLHGLFQIEAVDAAQYQQVLGVPLLPYAFRSCLVNRTGTDLTAVDTHWLKMYPYNEEVQ